MKRFGGHRNAAAIEQTIDVAGGMTDGEHDDFAGNRLAFSDDADDSARLTDEIDDAGVESNLAAGVDDLPAQRFDDRGKAIASKVRFRFIDDRRFSLGIGKDAKRFVARRDRSCGR